MASILVKANGTTVALEGITGLDIISNLLEGNSLLSPNYAHYGNVHNDLHANLAFAADPLHEYKVISSLELKVLTLETFYVVFFFSKEKCIHFFCEALVMTSALMF